MSETGASYTLTGQISTTVAVWEHCLLIRVSIEDRQYLVKDSVGTRYGCAPFLGDALADWMSQVDEILAMQSDPLCDPLKSEVAAYKRALSR